MMNLLLDTHVLVWAESSTSRLGGETKKLLLDESNALFVSPITTFELARLVALSRLTLRKPLGDWLAAARTHLGFKDVLMTHEIAMEAYSLPGDLHKDPADRILVATARSDGSTLITADEVILEYPHVLTHDART